MRKLLTIFVVAVLAIGSVADANMITLQFNANDIFNSAGSDGLRVDQQGTARRIYDSPTGRYYHTYSDVGRDAGATATQDVDSVASILGWNGATAGYQGVSHIQLWLQGGNEGNWAGKIVQNTNVDLTISVDETGWQTTDAGGSHVEVDDNGGYDTVHFNTILGGTPETQNALSAWNQADNAWSVTGDFYVDNNGNGIYDTGDEDLVLNQQYTIWFHANFNNWRCVDDYGNDAWGSLSLEGSIMATAVPEPTTIALVGLGTLGLFRKKR